MKLIQFVRSQRHLHYNRLEWRNAFLWWRLWNNPEFLKKVAEALCVPLRNGVYKSCILNEIFQEVKCQ
jgi:hypothetical protein